MSTIDLILVNYCTSWMIHRQLERLKGWIADRQVSVYLVDAGSPRGGLGDGGPFPCNPHLEMLEQNRGFGQAANAGTALGTSPWLMFLNPDVEVSPECMAALSDSLTDPSEVHGGVSSLGPRSHGPPAGSGSRNPMEVQWISGSLMAVARRIFEDVGGFDEAYFMYFEDVDLCERLRRRSCRCLVHRDVSYVHRGHGAYAESGRDQARDYRLSKQLYLGRRYGRLAGWAYGALTRLRGLA